MKAIAQCTANVAVGSNADLSHRALDLGSSSDSVAKFFFGGDGTKFSGTLTRVARAT